MTMSSDEEIKLNKLKEEIKLLWRRARINAFAHRAANKNML
jgi:hypothetical protein